MAMDVVAVSIAEAPFLPSRPEEEGGEEEKEKEEQEQEEQEEQEGYIVSSFFHRGLILFPLFHFLYISPPLVFSFSLAGRTTVSTVLHRQQSSASLHSPPSDTPNNTPPPPLLSPRIHVASSCPRVLLNPGSETEQSVLVRVVLSSPLYLLQLTLTLFPQPPFFHILSLYQQCQPQQPRPQHQHQPPVLLRYPHDHRL